MDIKNTHQKHAKLTRPNYGHFGRNEWAIIGTPCGKIQRLAYQLTAILSENYKVAYVDADHKSADDAAEEGPDLNTAMGNGATLEYTDKITFHRFDQIAELDSYQFRQQFNEQDLVLVNGNHFKAKKQIVVIDPKKEVSLSKKLDRLTDVAMFLTTDPATDIYPFLKEHLENWQDIPCYAIEEIEHLATALNNEMEANKAPLMGLVLAGGKSQRMGHDKGAINYHGKAQREYAADLLNKYCDKTFISVRANQVDDIESDYTLLADSFEGLGPFGAILSAFREYPNHAWLVVACDLPLLDANSIRQLVEARNASQIATAFNSPVNEFPEPLIAIWEPRSYPVLFQFLAQGYSCPRKVLINSPVELIDAKQPEALMNVNHPEEVEEAKNLIKG
jgi:molybdopterin-guanine dinucleotide biosynthesis protein A/molybdopterin-guanine dinucleotide biosynthesis protein